VFLLVLDAPSNLSPRTDIILFSSEFASELHRSVGARGSVVVKALCCKPEGRGFKSRWGGFFKLT
jgi:hypothetical protein